MTAEIHSLSGAYVLNALDDRERAEFERHVSECASCALEVTELTETAARLADDAWSVPPPRLRTEVLNRISQTRQSPPVRPTRAPRARKQSWRHRTMLALAAAAAVGLASIGGAYIVNERRADQVIAQENALIDKVIAAPDATLRTGEMTTGGRIAVVTSQSLNAAVITVAQAPKPGADQAYQLWMIRDGRPVSAGTLPAGSGDSRRYVPGVGGAQTVAVTVEPKAGSAQPTTPIVGQVGL